MALEAIRSADTSSQAYADLASICASIAENRPIDPDVLKRVQEESASIIEELKKRGPTNIAVDLIREGRDE